jgi:hypothetical protein
MRGEPQQEVRVIPDARRMQMTLTVDAQPAELADPASSVEPADPSPRCLSRCDPRDIDIAITV